MKETIYKEDAINAIKNMIGIARNEKIVTKESAMYALRALPSADSVSKEDVLGWLLAYHTKSFDLKGRYYPHEVIGWLTADISRNLFADAEGEQDG